MKSIGSVEPDQLFDEGRAYFQRRERDIRRVLLETARQGEREGVILAAGGRGIHPADL